MALTDEEKLNLIFRETNAAPGLATYEDDPVLSVLLPQYWELYANKDATYSGLRLMYTKRSLIDYLLGQARSKAKIQIGQDIVDLTPLVRNLQAMRAAADEDINKFEGNTVITVTPKSNLPSAYNRRLYPPFGEDYRR